jgi:hypothetical protein
MPVEDPNAEIANQVRQFEGEVEALRGRARLDGPCSKIQALQAAIAGLPGRVSQARAGGYVFEATLENQVEELAQSWASSYTNLSQQMALQGPDLEWSYNTLASEAQQLSQMAAMNPSAAQGALFQGRSTLESFKMRVGAVEKSLTDQYGQFESQVDPMVHLLDRIDWSLAQAAQAQFAWQAGEAPIMAAKAQWLRGGKDEPEGVLYLTDQRALFEQKQEIATKKILFVATQKQMVQQLLWQAPLGEVQNLTASKRGLFKNEDHLEITTAGAGLAHFHLRGQDCEQWYEMMARVQAGGYAADRVPGPSAPPPSAAPVAGTGG